MNKYVAYLSLTILLLQVACVAQQGGSSSLNDSFSEDLTLVRTKYEPENVEATTGKENVVEQKKVKPATKTVNTKVDMVLDSIDRLNQLRKFVDGYTIQIYSGPNREDALGAKAKMVKAISDLEANIQYSQPKFRVTVGRYFSKLEAQRDFMRLRDYFSNAILVPEKIQIK